MTLPQAHGAAAQRPAGGTTAAHACLAYVHARYLDVVDFGGTPFSGNTLPNVPTWVANAGTSYRFATRWTVEVGATVRYVGNRFTTDNNEVTMLSYTIADAFAFVDIPRTDLPVKLEQSDRPCGRSSTRIR